MGTPLVLSPARRLVVKMRPSGSWKRFDEILEVALHGLSTMMRRGIGILNGGLPAYLRVVQAADGIEVAAVERLVPVPRQSHVLLRHRPRSIPQGSGVGVSVLLRQPHGSEGVGAARIHLVPCISSSSRAAP